MQIFAKYELQETITDREKVMEVRQVGGRHLQQLMQSGKVRASGVFADSRGGFFVLEVDSAEELSDLFAPVLDYIRIETHPLTTVEKLQEFLERDATAAALADLRRMKALLCLRTETLRPGPFFLPLFTQPPRETV